MSSFGAIAQRDTFARWIEILETRFSIQIDAIRYQALHSALEQYASGLGINLEKLLFSAEQNALQADHWTMILHLATNHETRFFRSPAALTLIKEISKSLRSPRILSVGCSSGEEPYSIAVELLMAGMCAFRIHGTDVSAVCIETALAGIYPKHDSVPARAASTSRTHMSFHAWVRSLVSFEQHNILSERPIAFSRPNIVLTQNMLIYYRPEARYEILDRLANLLDPGGYLITGPAEAISWAGTGLIRHPHTNLTVFQRPADV
ncbi:CheR family methyltransferase [Pseudomonas sp. NCHU5208]|uniref:CheR family methyltransferase n=1 Tax=unclassified Pseudomonas TaxID=196821 RepID=UPI003F977659